jgi:hypothetical protein
MGAHHRGVEHLNQVRGAAGCSEGVEEGFEHARLAQAPEALPDRVPVPKCGGQGPPGDVMDRKVVQRFEERAVIPALVAPPRAHRSEHLNHDLPILIRHPRQHGRPPQTGQPEIKNQAIGESAHG